MTYLEKYKSIFKRFIKEYFNNIEIDGVMLSNFNENNLPDDLPHTLGGSFTYNDCIEHEYSNFFDKYCIDIFVNDLIHVIEINYPNVIIDKLILKLRIKERYLFSYLNEKIDYKGREHFIKMFYNSKIN